MVETQHPKKTVKIPKKKPIKWSNKSLFFFFKLKLGFPQFCCCYFIDNGKDKEAPKKQKKKTIP
jgi:hypothetical protein